MPAGVIRTARRAPQTPPATFAILRVTPAFHAEGLTGIGIINYFHGEALDSDLVLEATRFTVAGSDRRIHAR